MRALFTTLTRIRDTKQAKLKVVEQVSPDLEDLIRGDFPHPENGSVDTHSMTAIVWGLLKLGLATHAHCKEMLGLLDKHLESCEPGSLAISMDCFFTANYSSSSLVASRLEKAIENCYLEAPGHSLARYLYRCEEFGITKPVVKLKVA